MGRMFSQPGAHMAAEIAEAADVFERAALVDCGDEIRPLNLEDKAALYTIARGSSDAAANVLAYEFMRELGLPVTSLPPSVFSLGGKVRMEHAAAILISQSGGSEDLVRSAKGVRKAGGSVVAITNVAESPVERASDVTLPIAAGAEIAVPATKTVIGSLAAGMSLLSALKPEYAARVVASVESFGASAGSRHPEFDALSAALLRNPHVYVIGRDTGFGAAQEVALKIKETCAIHAEAYSSSEVLHGPLQLVTRPLLVIILDTEAELVQDSLNTAESRFTSAGGTVFRVRPSDVGARGLTPIAAAAMLLYLIYPVILSVAVSLGQDPDAPATLAKVTQTT